MHRFTFGLFFLYILIMTTLMIALGVGIAPDRYAFILILPAFLISRLRPFLLDWIPFIFILISYDFLRGFADFLNPRVNYFTLIDADQIIFGTLPTISLQNIFYNPAKLDW